MTDTTETTPSGNTPKAAKDKNCQFCGQAFTSSSLGRHLDLYIKEKNPKAPDGVHIVDEIRQLRGNITRRQPKGAGTQRDTMTPIATPAIAAHKSPASDTGSSNIRSPTTQKDGRSPLDYTSGLTAFAPRWEVTGVIGDALRDGRSKPSMVAEGSQDATRLQATSRVLGRQGSKSQIDLQKKMQDALDSSRAAELALREVISSWRAAKLQIDMNSMPFDFDPLSLDFPALALQCLKTPPTLFSSTQLPTSTSWSIEPPGSQQYNALQSYFAEEFRKWKITCSTATTAISEDISYPPRLTAVQPDTNASVRKAMKTAESLEGQVKEHLHSAFDVWGGLSPERRQELWVLELARGAGRKAQEVNKLKDSEHRLQQENANLISQIEQLNRLQQPREYKLFSPTTVPFDREFLVNMQEDFIVAKQKRIGLDVNDRHSDLNTLVSSAIERWKTVVTSTRVATNASRQADQPAIGDSTRSSGSDSSRAASDSAPTSHPTVPVIRQPPTVGRETQSPSASQASNVDEERATPAQEARQSTVPTQAVPSIEDVSDQDADADAEMEDDDSFAQMNTTISKAPQPRAPRQQTSHLDVQRTRGAGRRKSTNGVVKNKSAPQAKSRNATSLGSRKAALLDSNASALGLNGGASKGADVKTEPVTHAADPSEEQDGDGDRDPMYMDE